MLNVWRQGIKNANRLISGFGSARRIDLTITSIDSNLDCGQTMYHYRLDTVSNLSLNENRFDS